MKWFQHILVAILFILMQLVVADRISLGRIAPDFLILIVAFFALYRGKIQGSVFGFLVGFLQDLTNPSYMGLNALAKTILGYAVGSAGKKTFPENAPFLFALFMAASFGHDFIYTVIYTWPQVGSTLVAIFTVALPSAAYTAIFGVLMHRFMALATPKSTRAYGKEGQ